MLRGDEEWIPYCIVTGGVGIDGARFDSVTHGRARGARCVGLRSLNASSRALRTRISRYSLSPPPRTRRSLPAQLGATVRKRLTGETHFCFADGNSRAGLEICAALEQWATPAPPMLGPAGQLRSHSRVQRAARSVKRAEPDAAIPPSPTARAQAQLEA